MAFSIKICGVRDADAALAAAAAGADRVGLVFFAASPRALTPAAATALSADIARRAPGLIRVGLMVDPEDALIDAVAPYLDDVQLHGAETPERVAEIAARTGKPVWKALGVRTASDVSAASDYEGAAAGLYFDAKPPAGADRPGGLGAAFDWSLLSRVDGTLPWLLSGGLRPETVGDAIGAVRDCPGFAGVDVSSGVESAPGVKDLERVRAFIDAARAACGET